MDQYLYAKLARVDNPLTANLVWIDGVAYAKLNKEVEKNVYNGKSTDTANTIVDNANNLISVEVIRTPNKLTIKEAESLFDTFDGSRDVIIDLTPYQKRATSWHHSQLNNNTLEFYNEDNILLDSVELSPFVQEQSDLAEEDDTQETFVKNKKTQYLENTGEDGTSPYATQEWVREYKPKISWLEYEESDWTALGQTFKLTIPSSTHNVSNPYIDGMLIYNSETNRYDNNIPTYSVLPNDDVQISSYDRIKCKVMIKGDN